MHSTSKLDWIISKFNKLSSIHEKSTCKLWLKDNKVYSCSVNHSEKIIYWWIIMYGRNNDPVIDGKVCLNKRNCLIIITLNHVENFFNDKQDENISMDLCMKYNFICWIVLETVSADGRSARPARLGVHPIWWRWHGNTKSLSKVQSSDV